MGKMDRIYVADGHHRAAAAVKIAQKRRKENPDYTGKESFNYFLSVLFPWDELWIVEYNRVVKDLGGKTGEELLKEVEKCFQIEKEGACPVKPEKKGTFGLYVEKTWYRLTIKEEYKSPDPQKIWMYLFFRTVFWSRSWGSGIQKKIQDPVRRRDPGDSGAGGGGRSGRRRCFHPVSDGYDGADPGGRRWKINAA